MEDQQIARQIALEDTMRAEGIARYTKSMTSREESELPPGALLLRTTVHPLSEYIAKWAADLRVGNPRRFASLLGIIEKVGFPECAYMTLRRAINALSVRGKLTATAISLAEDLEDELGYRAFKEANPFMFNRTLDDIKEAGSETYRTKVLSLMRRRAGVEDLGWSKEDKLKLGTKLLEMGIEATGLFEMNTVMESGRRAHYIMGTEKTREWLSKQHGHCQLMAPLMLPMICKPNDWVTPRQGGYFTHRMDMVKTTNRNYLDELEHIDMPMVYSSLNTLQSTAWRINKRIHSVMREVWEVGGDRAGLPGRFPKPIPNKPLDIATNKEALSAWKQKAHAAHSFNHRNMSKLAGVGQKLWVAEKFEQEEEMFFVWSMDWRGRAYASGNFVNPQSDDSGKALLEFAHGKPLGEMGVAWLAVQLANTWGNDKVSFDDRIQWAHDNTPDILGYALDPMVNNGWMEADSPFGFLAACFEWLGYSMEGEAHVCHLPIQVDGSCNGLQNFSAMLRDEIGGRATNLIPSDKPQDIYSLVAAETAKVVEHDFAQGVPEAGVFRGKINRKLTKRNTMTMPYSVTQYGMKDQLIEEFRKMEEKGEGLDFTNTTEMKAASYLAGINYQSIGQVVVAARQAMDWLKAVARVAASDSLPVLWTNPAGMPIQQSYMDSTGKLVKVYFNGRRTEFHVKVEGKKLNGRKQAAGIAPNFVHSCDSGHMMRTLTKSREAGLVDFSFIHDSFGTHACDMGTMSELLREAFVEQYSGDVLGQFRDEIVEQLERSGAGGLVEQIPPVPPMGALDLSAVLHSEYFFA